MWWLTGVIKDQVKTKNDLVLITLLLGPGHLKLMEMIPSVPTLCDPVDYSPPGSSVHGILQGRTLEWVAIQGIFPTQDRTPARRGILYYLSHQASPLKKGESKMDFTDFFFPSRYRLCSFFIIVSLFWFAFDLHHPSWAA